ncbi:hypothetical protein A7P25_18980 [Achromobacter xylosoxidans]|nr:hypothetical protein A7P25_18980 [Achromobacter xylosoxidans]
MNAQYAYVLGFSGAGVTLGAVDSGYLTTHQQFANRGVTGLRITGTYRLSYAGEFGGGNRLHTGTLQARWRC